MSGGKTSVKFIGDVSKKDSNTLIDVALVCPWCGVSSRSESHILSSLRSDRGGVTRYAVCFCQSRDCARPVFLVIDDEYGHFFAHPHPYPAEVHPQATADYGPDGVPEKIADEFCEALECAWSGHWLGSALVGRRVLQAACRDVLGRKGKDLKEEIEDIPLDRLNKGLKDQATHVRFIGNDAAHVEDVDADDVRELLDFVEQVLDALYVAPHRVAQLTAKRDAKKAAKATAAAKGTGTP